MRYRKSHDATKMDYLFLVPREVTFPTHKGCKALSITTDLKISASGPKITNPHRGNAAVQSISS
jgi:hypothetical protein